MSRHRINRKVGEAILATDVRLLEDHAASEEVIGLMLAEHAARVQTLSRLIDPIMARTLLMMVASALIAEAKSTETKG